MLYAKNELSESRLLKVRARRQTDRQTDRWTQTYATDNIPTPHSRVVTSEKKLNGRFIVCARQLKTHVHLPCTETAAVMSEYKMNKHWNAIKRLLPTSARDVSISDTTCTCVVRSADCHRTRSIRRPGSKTLPPCTSIYVCLSVCVCAAVELRSGQCAAFRLVNI